MHGQNTHIQQTLIFGLHKHIKWVKMYAYLLGKYYWVAPENFLNSTSECKHNQRLQTTTGSWFLSQQGIPFLLALIGISSHVCTKDWTGVLAI